MSQPSRKGLSGVFNAVKDRLNLGQRDDYNPVAFDEDTESRVPLASPAPPYGDIEDASTGLLNHHRKTKHQRRTGCCICCGVDCSLFWKIIGLIVAAAALWNAFRLIRWAVTDAPTGLENMPTFSKSLGCLKAPQIYNTTNMVMTAPMGTEFEHSFDIRGSAVGTFVIAQGDRDLQDVKYEMTLRSEDAALLDDIDIRFPDIREDGSVLNSRLLITTPRTGPDSGCMRYDITMYVPPKLKKLHVASHTTMHIEFDPKADLDIHDLYITMFSMSKNNLVVPSRHIRGNHMALEVYRGWVVGDVAVVNSTTITTQRGDGITNVHVYPTTPIDPTNPEPAFFRTTTGAGRTDISYVTPKEFKRSIRNVHLSSRNADMYLNYRKAEFNGRIQLDSTSYTATGTQRLPEIPKDEGGGSPRWTHWVGDRDGRDQILVKSRGWSGLYF
ncbi:hypothetical protein H0H81_002345 [Sphagnurus paluster]|uniref:Uncharacterized protein n=1 Tax=Sphagnurus paluster TaxID=117069 RepID=A0A9P7FVR2_9AGAR|nr:hypothetical protein H0H81_002345 [Sphagnurus paluster]